MPPRHFQNLIPLLSVGVLACAVLMGFRACLPAPAKANESFDYVDFYEPAARSLLNGSGLLYDQQPATKYPLGFPLFLAAHYWVSEQTDLSERTLLSISAIVCYALAAMLLFSCARRLQELDQGARWYRSMPFLVTVLWIIYPAGLWLFKQPNSEVPFVALLFASFRLFIPLLCHRNAPSDPSNRALQAFATGICVGLTSLIRPITIGMGFVMAGSAIVLSKNDRSSLCDGRWKNAAILLLGNLLAVLPWEYWVWQKTERIVPLSTLGVQALYEGVTYGLNNDGTRNENIRVPSDILSIMTAVHSHVADGSLQSFGDMAGVLQTELQNSPMSVAKLYVLKAGRAWIGTDSGRMENALLLIQGLWLVIISGMLIRQYSRGHRPTTIQWFLILLTLYFWALVTLTFSIARYMTPVMGLLLLATLAPKNRPVTSPR